MQYETVRVKMPNGSVRKAQLTSSKTRDGYRSVQVGMTDNVKVAGRVPSRHGFKDGRVLPIEIKLRDIQNLNLRADSQYDNIYVSMTS